MLLSFHYNKLASDFFTRHSSVVMLSLEKASFLKINSALVQIPINIFQETDLNLVFSILQLEWFTNQKPFIKLTRFLNLFTKQSINSVKSVLILNITCYVTKINVLNIFLFFLVSLANLRDSYISLSYTIKGLSLSITLNNYKFFNVIPLYLRFFNKSFVSYNLDNNFYNTLKINNSFFNSFFILRDFWSYFFDLHFGKFIWRFV